MTPRAWGRAVMGLTLVSTMFTSAPAHAEPKPWTVDAIRGGHRVTLRLNEPLPVRDALPELAVDGRTLGRAQQSPDGRTLTIETSDPRAARPTIVEVAWNGEVPSKTAGRTATPAAPKATGKPLPVDPGARGPYDVERVAYDLGDTAIELQGIGGRPAEIRAAAYLPKTSGERPLVVFLHGRHAACWNPIHFFPTNHQWPCPEGDRRYNSHQGYEQAADVLASQGYAVVSISANGIAVADDRYSDDAGALARGELVMRHLDLLAAATKGSGDATLAGLFEGRLDMSDIGLMGHSRGGEGLVKATMLNDQRRKPYRIRAVLALAPTDFARATLPGVPMAVLLPYCDGDVSDQQGQHLYEDTRYTYAKDRAFRSSVMLMGANHNFFNAEWTPGVTWVPARDDWWRSDDPICGFEAPTRLRPEEQYAAGTAYIAGFFRLIQGGEKAFLPLFDGSGGTLGDRFVAHSVAMAPDRRRLDVASFTSLPASVSVTGSATGVICAGMLDRSLQSGLPSCATTLTTEQAPSWTPTSYAPNVASTPVLRFSWTDTTGRVSASLPPGSGNVGRYDALTFRAALDEASANADLAVTVTDGKGTAETIRVSEVSDALSKFPGAKSPLAKTWLRTVRIPATSLKGLDLRNVREVTIAGASATGGVYLADLAFSDSDEGRADASKLPQVSVQDLTVPEGDGPGIATMTLTLSRRSRLPVTVNVQSIATGAAPVIAQVAREIVIPARARSATFQIPLAGDTAPAPTEQSYQVVASAPVNAVIGTGFARLVVTDDEVT